jgi:hypothetical protein
MLHLFDMGCPSPKGTSLSRGGSPIDYYNRDGCVGDYHYPILVKSYVYNGILHKNRMQLFADFYMILNHMSSNGSAFAKLIVPKNICLVINNMDGNYLVH